MNIVNLLKTIQKLKAGMCVLFENNQELIMKTKELYFNKRIISLDEEDKQE